MGYSNSKTSSLIQMVDIDHNGKGGHKMIIPLKYVKNQNTYTYPDSATTVKIPQDGSYVTCFVIGTVPDGSDAEYSVYIDIGGTNVSGDIIFSSNDGNYGDRVYKSAPNGILSKDTYPIIADATTINVKIGGYAGDGNDLIIEVFIVVEF
jgi:hypothetical protein